MWRGWWGGRGVWVSVRQQSCWWPEVHCSGGGSLSDHSQHPDQDSSTPPSTTSHQSADKVTPHSPSIPTHPCVCLERPITNFQAPRGVPSLPHYSPNMREKRVWPVWPQLREIQTWSKSTGHWLLFWSRPRPLRWSVLAAGDSSGAVLHSSTATHRLIISRIMAIVCQIHRHRYGKIPN